MKKFIALLFMFTLCMAPAEAQILKSLGEKALKSATEGAKNAVGKQITKRAEKKAESAVNDALNKAFGEVKEDTLEAATAQNMSALGKALGDATAAYSNAVTGAMSAGAANVTLRDFSEQNAARKEHNKTLTYDNWD